MARKPKLAVWKFASCDGCQLSLLDCEDELLAIAEKVEIAHFPEASRAVSEGPYDLSLVEGSITTSRDVERIREVRRASRFLVTIGACATAGGIQALRNFQDVEEFMSVVYAHPEYISTLDRSAHRRPCPRRLRAARLPDQQASIARAAERPPERPASQRSRSQRVRGMQAAGHPLRHGRPRHAVSGTGHPGRLRRSLPCLRPRLLRLLRSGGEPQHRFPQPGLDGPRRGRQGPGPGLSRVQRLRRALPAGERAA